MPDESGIMSYGMSKRKEEQNHAENHIWRCGKRSVPSADLF